MTMTLLYKVSFVFLVLIQHIRPCAGAPVPCNLEQNHNGLRRGKIKLMQSAVRAKMKTDHTAKITLPRMQEITSACESSFLITCTALCKGARCFSVVIANERTQRLNE